MLTTLITCCFLYILAGSLVWMLTSPGHTDFATSRYCARRGHLPTAGFMGVAIAGVILLWPKVVAAQLKAMRGRL